MSYSEVHRREIACLGLVGWLDGHFLSVDVSVLVSELLGNGVLVQAGAAKTAVTSLELSAVTVLLLKGAEPLGIVRELACETEPARVVSEVLSANSLCHLGLGLHNTVMTEEAIASLFATLAAEELIAELELGKQWVDEVFLAGLCEGLLLFVLMHGAG